MAAEEVKQNSSPFLSCTVDLPLWQKMGRNLLATILYFRCASITGEGSYNPALNMLYLKFASVPDAGDNPVYEHSVPEDLPLRQMREISLCMNILYVRVCLCGR